MATRTPAKAKGRGAHTNGAPRVIRPRASIAGSEETHHHLHRGINLITDLLAPTFGPVSGHIVNERTAASSKAELLDDSATAVRRILSLGDPRVDVGAMLMRNIVWKMTQEIGDGGAMTAILTRAIFNDAMRLIQAGISYRNLENGVRRAVEEVQTSLQSQTQPVENEDQLSAVAYGVSRDRPLAALAGEMAFLLGPDARINVQKYVAPYLEREYHAGASYEAQIASYLLYSDSVRKRAVHTDVAVALVDGSLTDAQQSVALLEAALATKKKALLILANHFKESALHVIVANQQAEKKQISLLGASLKVVGEERRQAFDDLALLTGAEVLGRPHTRSVDRCRPEDLGDANRVEIGTKSLRLLPTREKAQASRQQIEEIRRQLADLPQNAEARPGLMLRLASLSGGMGVFKVGATSKYEREVRADNAERALKVLSMAQTSGVAPGGGAAFFHAARNLNLEHYEGEEKMGAEVISRALIAPLDQILHNCRVERPGLIKAELGERGLSGAYDARREQVIDARRGEVLDVTGVLSAALRTAVSGALMALSTDAIVYHRNPKQSIDP